MSLFALCALPRICKRVSLEQKSWLAFAKELIVGLLSMFNRWLLDSLLTDSAQYLFFVRSGTWHAEGAVFCTLTLFPHVEPRASCLFPARTPQDTTNVHKTLSNESVLWLLGIAAIARFAKRCGRFLVSVNRTCYQIDSYRAFCKEVGGSDRGGCVSRSLWSAIDVSLSSGLLPFASVFFKRKHTYSGGGAFKSDTYLVLFLKCIIWAPTSFDEVTTTVPSR